MDEEYDAIVLGTGLKVSFLRKFLVVTLSIFKFIAGEIFQKLFKCQPVVGLVIFLVGTAILSALYCDLMFMFYCLGMYRQWHALRIGQKGASYG